MTTTTLAKLTEDDLERTVTIPSTDGQGLLGLLVQFPADGLTVVALWSGDRCHQHAYPAETPCTVDRE